MQLFDLVLLVKIVGTAAGVVVPLALVPPGRAAAILQTDVSAMRYLRLYAMAVTALLVGYASGFSWWRETAFPHGVAWMGLVSNGGAAVILLTGGYVRPVKLSGLFFGAIAVALAASLTAPDLAVRQL